MENELAAGGQWNWNQWGPKKAPQPQEPANWGIIFSKGGAKGGEKGGQKGGVEKGVEHAKMAGNLN